MTNEFHAEIKNPRQRRRVEALVRQEERANRGDAGQLARLEARGFGECKEAQNLRRKLSLGKPTVPEAAIEKE